MKGEEEEEEEALQLPMAYFLVSVSPLVVILSQGTLLVFSVSVLFLGFVHLFLHMRRAGVGRTE